jgi:hypothetical protein
VLPSLFSARELLWLATHTPFDGFRFLDDALPRDRAEHLWEGVVDEVRQACTPRGPLPKVVPGPVLGRGEALVGALALALSRSPAAARRCTLLADTLNDAVLASALFARPATRESEPLTGEFSSTIRGRGLTTLLGFSGLLFLAHGISLFFRVAFGFRRPARVTVSFAGLRLRTRTELLGRKLFESEVLIPREGLVRVYREVRYPRLAFYTGLIAMALGSYFGLAFVIDGARAASPSLLAAGFLVAAVGLSLDFVFASLAPGATGRCRVVFELKKGKPVCISHVSIAKADVVLPFLR